MLLPVVKWGKVRYICCGCSAHLHCIRPLSLWWEQSQHLFQVSQYLFIVQIKWEDEQLVSHALTTWGETWVWPYDFMAWHITVLYLWWALQVRHISTTMIILSCAAAPTVHALKGVLHVAWGQFLSYTVFDWDGVLPWSRPARAGWSGGIFCCLRCCSSTGILVGDSEAFQDCFFMKEGRNEKCPDTEPLLVESHGVCVRTSETETHSCELRCDEFCDNVCFPN